MSERMATWIAIGGNLPQALLPELCKAISDEQLSREWGGKPFEPTDADDLKDAIDELGQLFLCHEEATGGAFDNLETFLRQSGLPYNRHAAAKYEYDTQLVQFRPGLGVLNHLASEDGRPLVEQSEVQKIREALQAGNAEEALTLAEKLCPKRPQLPPFQIVDQSVVLMSDPPDVDTEE
jgi:hypothetical protein